MSITVFGVIAIIFGVIAIMSALLLIEGVIAILSDLLLDGKCNYTFVDNAEWIR